MVNIDTPSGRVHGLFRNKRGKQQKVFNDASEIFFPSPRKCPSTAGQFHSTLTPDKVHVLLAQVVWWWTHNYKAVSWQGCFPYKRPCLSVFPKLLKMATLQISHGKEVTVAVTKLRPMVPIRIAWGGGCSSSNAHLQLGVGIGIEGGGGVIQPPMSSSGLLEAVLA